MGLISQETLNRPSTKAAVAVGVAAQLSDDVLSGLLPGVSGFPWLISVAIALAATGGGAYAVGRVIREPRNAGTVGLMVGGVSAVAGLLIGTGGLIIAILTVVAGLAGSIAAGQQRVSKAADADEWA